MSAQAFDAKLDGQLEILLHTAHVADSSQFPVVVRVASGHLEAVVKELRELGRVRHVMSPLNAVSAWLPMTAIRDILPLTAVEGIELAQPIEVAGVK